MKLRSSKSLITALFILGLIILSSLIANRLAIIPTMVSGIAVYDRYNAATFFPLEWLWGPPKCEGKQADLIEAQRILPMIEEMAAIYGPDVISRNLKDIYLLSELRCYGRQFGGTNGTSSLYITVGSKENGFSDQFLYSMLHGEFSSILMRNYEFPSEVWAAINEGDFTYSNDAVQVVGQAETYNRTEELLKAGFLWQYSTTSLENDFNDITSWLFAQEMELCDLRSQYERIEKKAALAISFYHTVNPDIEFASCM